MVLSTFALFLLHGLEMESTETLFRLLARWPGSDFIVSINGIFQASFFETLDRIEREQFIIGYSNSRKHLSLDTLLFTLMEREGRSKQTSKQTKTP